MTPWLLPVLCATVAAPPAGPPPRPLPPADPLLFVRVLPTDGSTVTYLPATTAARRFEKPESVGLRPGYCYRIRLDSPDVPGVPLFPSLEVRGAVAMHPEKAVKHPATLKYTADELAAVRAGAIITKVLYIECPDLAPPTPTTADDPLEFDAACEEDALTEARHRGRVVCIARLGDRVLSDDELFAGAIPGTVLLPGMRGLTPPAAPPMFGPKFWPLYDPILGPKPLTEECLRDGGDGGRPVGIGPDGRVGGLDPADAAIEFTDKTGRRQACVSNAVNLCVPRFPAVRVVQTPIPVVSPLPPVPITSTKAGEVVVNVTPPLVVISSKELVELVGRVVVSGIIGRQGPGVVQNDKHPVEVIKDQGPREQIGQKGPREVVVYPCKLLLVKDVYPREAQIGDEVTYSLRYFNSSASTMTDVAISDSLTARLEYMADTAKSDRPAVFTVTPNEAGSAVLRWEITGPLEPGQGGVLTFKARIR